MGKKHHIKFERFVPVASIPDYLVSDIGRVYSKKTNRFLSQSFCTCGYPKVNLFQNGTQKSVRVHRLVAEAFIENPDGKPQVNHIDGVRSNNSASNLEYCTNTENTNHAIAIGIKKAVFGTNHGRSKLTAQDVRDIRKHLADGIIIKSKLARIYNVGWKVISQIERGISYRDVD